MQPVRKTRQPGRGKTTVIVLLMALASILAWYATRLNSPVPLPETAPEERVILIRREESELARFEVVSSQGDRFALIQGPEGHYSVEGQPDYPLDPAQLQLMVRDLTVLDANEEAGRVEMTDEALDALGLGARAARVTAEYADGSQITLILGNSAMTEIPSDYLMLLGSDRVYTVSPETREHFDRTLATLHPVPAINITSALVDEVRFEGRDALRLRQEEGLWEIVAPFAYPAQPEQVSRLLSNISRMRFALYHSEATPQALRDTGLDPPARTVTLLLSPSTIIAYDEEGLPARTRQVDAQQLRIALGNDIDKIGLYCLYEGKIYQASNASMGFLRDAALSELLSDAPVTLPVNRLSALHVEEGRDSREYRIEMVEQVLPNNQIGRDAQGNILFEPYITKNAQEYDWDTFLRGYIQLMNLRRAGRVREGFQAAEKTPVRRYLLYTGERLAWELALFPYDALHYAVRVNGRFVDYVTRAQADLLAL